MEDIIEQVEEIKQFDDYEMFEEALGGEDPSQEHSERDTTDVKKHTKRGEGRYMRLVSDKQQGVLDFMLLSITDRSRTTVRSFLKNRQVSINGIPTSQFDATVKEGDVVEVNFGVVKDAFKHSMLDLIYEDDHILVVNKKNGLLTMATDREREKTAYFILSQYLKGQDPSNKIFIVHRLDRETSGLVIFAKSMEIQHHLQQNWAEVVLERRYVAVCCGCPNEQSGVVESYLKENKAFIMYSTNGSEGGDYARTRYTVLKQSRTKSLVELELETGRKNQIRVHMKDLGCPIFGDKKYGGEASDMNRVALHASRIKFIHPVTQKEMLFDTGIPNRFHKYFFFK